MRAVIVYESMYGNTRVIAEAIAAGLAPAEVSVVPVAQASADVVAGTDLLVVGGPTHMFGMSRPKSREAADEATRKPGSELHMEPGAVGPGLREWFSSLGASGGTAAAFDTRIEMAGFAGHASRGIRKNLQQHRYRLLAPSKSFFVTKENELRPGEQDRAREWGRELSALSSATVGQ
jgi:hypothetical protein